MQTYLIQNNTNFNDHGTDTTTIKVNRSTVDVTTTDGAIVTVPSDRIIGALCDLITLEPELRPGDLVQHKGLGHGGFIVDIDNLGVVTNPDCVWVLHVDDGTLHEYYQHDLILKNV